MHGNPGQSLLARFRSRIAPLFTGPAILAFLPALSLGSFWIGGEAVLMITALGLPLGFAIAGAFGKWPPEPDLPPRDAVTGLLLRDAFQDAARATLERTRDSGRKSACMLVELDEYHDLVRRHGSEAGDLVALRTGERIRATLREADMVARLDGARFAVCLAPVMQLDLELCIQLAGRIQSAVEDPVSLNGTAVYVSCCVGFCAVSQSPGASAGHWIEAADIALDHARQAGPSAIRAFSPDMQRAANAADRAGEEIAAALENGQIQPWFQPQISTDTGRVTGFEALARWSHPTRGVLGPDAFLKAAEAAGLSERLGQVMLYHALTALKAWDSAGAEVPRVGVNFASDELRNPALVEKVKWELDRFGLTPDRLSVEILESVVSNAGDDIVTRNIAGLGQLGCRIDLDDFGTGHSSIASIRRFAVSRIKIDRSFVMKADRDPDQQRMVSAILTMAEQLGLETLAEGVETVGEHALLAQLGCHHVQGFGIGRPMPFDQTLDWIAAHRAKLQDTPRIGRQTG